MSVTASNCNGTTVATTKAITIPLPSKPVAIIGNAAICEGSTQTYSVVPVTNSVVGSTTTYIWSVPADAITISGQSTNILIVKWGSISYTLSVVASNCNGTTLATTKAVAISKCIANELTTSVNDINESNLNIEVYPNPNNGQFTLSMTNNNLNNENVKLQVLNMIGQVVYTEIISSQDSGSSQKNDIQLSDLSVGTYFLQVLTSKEVFNRKIIIVK